MAWNFSLKLKDDSDMKLQVEALSWNNTQTVFFITFSCFIFEAINPPKTMQEERDEKRAKKRYEFVYEFSHKSSSSTSLHVICAT